MSIRRKSLKRFRKQAYRTQAGKCYYCASPIWEVGCEKFAKTYNLSQKQTNLLKSTGEHLVAHATGGQASKTNIVAACAYCNAHRHRSKDPLPPNQYKRYVRRRVKSGAWHQLTIHTASQGGSEVASRIRQEA
ncbi:HNH endonuclease [Candidatus Thiodiazotropha sp. CDECU1]|uniref:HNH endonuclease n=1 Tax=Candidatus Thiodiazotropha sp. CDECU1 TaxID=3065865 RepID=UPI003FA4C01C